MQHKTLLASLLGLAITGSATFALAQDAAKPAPTSAKPAAAQVHDVKTLRLHRDDFQGHDLAGMGHRLRGMHGMHAGAGSDLRALEALYADAGRSKELPALYNDVLAKTQDPALRTYVYHRLADLQAQPANIDQAVATLRKSLDENLANEAKQRAEREQMRSQWQQRRAANR